MSDVQTNLNGDGYTLRATHVRVFHNGSEWEVDGADEAGNYTHSSWTCPTHAEAVANIEAFVKYTSDPDHGSEQVTWDWRSPRKPATIPSWYWSQDAHPDVDDVPTWSVYREEYLPESFANGEPIDGSQEYVSTWPTEAEAEAEARRLTAVERKRHPVG